MSKPNVFAGLVGKAARDLDEACSLYGFDIDVHTDRRTGGAPELVIGYPHHWKFFVARRRGS